MKKIKILQIVPNMQQGGLENLVMNIIRNLDREKYEIHFLYHYTNEYFFDKEIKSLGGTIHKCSFRNDNNILKYLNFLNKFFKNNKFDIVHSHMLSTSYFTLKYAKKYGCKILINHAHNSTTEKSLKGFIKHKMIKIASKHANTLLACSYESGLFAYGKKEFTVIDNCIYLDRFKFSKSEREETRNSLNIKKNDILFGTIGRLNVQKNQMFLIKAFAKANTKNKKLLIIGSGELKEQILNTIKELQIENKVILLENIKKTEAYYNAMDCFVLPSIFEGFPLTAIEAQANGLPCIFSSEITKKVKLNKNIKFIPITDENNWSNEFNKFNLKRQSILSPKIEKYDVKHLIKTINSIYKTGVSK